MPKMTKGHAVGLGKALAQGAGDAILELGYSEELVALVVQPIAERLFDLIRDSAGSLNTAHQFYNTLAPLFPAIRHAPPTHIGIYVSAPGEGVGPNSYLYVSNPVSDTVVHPLTNRPMGQWDQGLAVDVQATLDALHSVQFSSEDTNDG